MKVQSTAWQTAKEITSQRLVLGFRARSESHAASRRRLGRWCAREAAGKIDAVEAISLVEPFEFNIARGKPLSDTSTFAFFAFSKNGAPAYYYYTIVVTDEYRASHEATIRKFLKAWQAGTDWAIKNPEEAAKVPHPCASLEEALENLERDHEFLTRGGVFSKDMLDAYVALKMEEVTRFRMTTHPIEFDMYYSL